MMYENYEGYAEDELDDDGDDFENYDLETICD